MDSNCHAREEDSNTDIYENGEIVSYLILHAWGNKAHVSIDKAAETDDWYGWGEWIADGYEIECHQVTDAARDGSVALMEDIHVNGSMKDVLMKERVA